MVCLVASVLVIGVLIYACIRINHVGDNEVKEYNLKGEEITIAECIDKYLDDDSRTLIDNGFVRGWNR